MNTNPSSLYHAVCWQSGRIQICRRKPEGSLLLAKGSRHKLRRLMQAKARHAYDGKTLLVPGVPEADSAGQAMTAAIKFRNWINQTR